MRLFKIGQFRQWQRTDGKVLIVTLAFLIGIGTGILIGYEWFRSEPPTVANERVTPAPPPKPAVIEPELALNPFESLQKQIREAIARSSYVDALNLTIDLDLLAQSETEVTIVDTLLDQILDLRVAQLQSRDQWIEIDQLYEDLTLAMPERAELLLALAEYRISIDNGDAALPVLAQIENHAQLGSRARELIDEITGVGNPLTTIPLIRSGDQFLVSALIDGHTEVTLLLDTGASMTVVTEILLASMGYSTDERRARFSTAGGEITAPVVEIDSLKVGDRQVDKLTVGGLPSDSRPSYRGEPIDGLLGMDFLSRFEFTVDQDAEVLEITAERHQR